MGQRPAQNTEQHAEHAEHAERPEHAEHAEQSARPEPTPFALGLPVNLARLPRRVGGVELLKISAPAVGERREEGAPPAADPVSGARVARLLNIGNALAYGGEMGMPEWVMLDCGLLPTTFMGLCRRAADLAPRARASLNERLARLEATLPESRARAERRLGVPRGPLRDDEWVPVAEFCALPTLTPGQVMGYSLFSLERGLGVRAKALGLALHGALGARAQLGVAQYSNTAALRAHLRFGPLELLDPLTPLHTRAGETFIYRLALPPEDALIDMAAGSRLRYTPHEPSPLGALIEERWLRADELEGWAALRAATQAGDLRAALTGARHTALGDAEVLVATYR